ncbi:MAG: hypothetical protein K2K36_07260, partial [Muribaculaceae bacterium]|nr:hypothetical protein [Muribaculaceae bacterium]
MLNFDKSGNGAGIASGDWITIVTFVLILQATALPVIQPEMFFRQMLHRMFLNTRRFAVVFAAALASLAASVPAFAAQTAPVVFPRSNSASIGVVVRDLTTVKDQVSNNAAKMLPQ